MITEVARGVVGCLDDGGICARWGGDEFIVLLQGSAPHLLRAAAAGIMAAISERRVNCRKARTPW